MPDIATKATTNMKNSNEKYELDWGIMVKLFKQAISFR
jgi:hypothetical protein